MIVIDGEQFKIDVLSVKRSADFLDKYAERLANGHLRRELIGVYFNYKLQFGPGLDRKEYARLWDKLTEPVEFHEVTVPDEDGDYTFTAYFSNVGDELLRKKAEKNYWKNLTANFIAQKPARTWTSLGLLTRAQMQRILDNLATVRAAYYTLPGTPNIPTAPSTLYSAINDMEQVLWSLHELWQRNSVKQYAGEICAGQEIGVI